MKLYEVKVTDDSEPTRLYLAAEDIQAARDVLTDQDLGSIDWDSVQPYVDGEKRPRAVGSLESIPEEYHDQIYMGENDDEKTVTEFFD